MSTFIREVPKARARFMGVMGNMKLLLIFSALLIPASLSAQELGKCPLALYNWIHATQYSESWNRQYLAIGDTNGLKFFQKNNDGYKLISDINLSVGPKTKLHISDHGKLVVWGDSFTDTQSDIIKIFTESGKLTHTLDADKIFTLNEITEVIELYEKIDDCTPLKPWICWEEEISFDDGKMHLVDALGRNIEIDIETGKSIIDNQNKQCSMFP